MLFKVYDKLVFLDNNTLLFIVSIYLTTFPSIVILLLAPLFKVISHNTSSGYVRGSEYYGGKK